MVSSGWIWWIAATVSSNDQSHYSLDGTYRGALVPITSSTREIGALLV